MITRSSIQVSDEALKPLIERLGHLVRDWQIAIEEELGSNDNGMRNFPFNPSLSMRSRFSPQTRADGLALAIWTIGDTVGRLGGGALMNRIFGMVEDKFGPSCSIVLEQRWNAAADLWYS